MDLTETFRNKLSTFPNKNVSKYDAPLTKTSGFTQAINQILSEVLTLSDHIEQISHLFITPPSTLSKMVYQRVSSDEIQNILLNHGIQPKGSNLTPLPSSRSVETAGLSRERSALVEREVINTLNRWKTILNGLRESVIAREAALADMKAVDHSIQSTLSLTSLSSLFSSPSSFSLSDQDEWAYTTGASPPPPLTTFRLGRPLNNLSNKNRGSEQYRHIVVEGEASNEGLKSRRAAVEIVEALIERMATEVKAMVVDRVEGASKLEEQDMNRKMHLIRDMYDSYHPSSPSTTSTGSSKQSKLQSASTLTSSSNPNSHSHSYSDPNSDPNSHSYSDYSHLSHSHDAESFISSFLQPRQHETMQTLISSQSSLSDSLSLATKVESTVSDINQLLAQFHTEVNIQAERIDTIHDNVEATGLNVEMGNTELQKALDRGSGGAKLYVIYFVVLTIIMLILDYIVP